MHSVVVSDRFISIAYLRCETQIDVHDIWREIFWDIIYGNFTFSQHLLFTSVLPPAHLTNSSSSRQKEFDVVGSAALQQGSQNTSIRM